jgi:hypothetical protein
MRIVRAGALYFALTFAAGFVLGPIRILWAIPRFGERVGELLEMPIMLGVIVLVSRWAVRRFDVPPSVWKRLAVGAMALGLLMVAELTVVIFVRGITVAEYIASRDPVAGAVYLAMLGVFMVMPVLIR